MKIEFIINWGYQMVYSRRLYHPVYRWDGELTASDPEASMQLELLDYPFVWCGVCYTPERTALAGNSWRDVVTRRGIGGLQVTAECSGDTVFTLKNRYGEFRFSVNDISGSRRVTFPVGGKYGFCVITVNQKDRYWFRDDKLLPGMVQLLPADTPLPVSDRRRMITAVLPPEKVIELPCDTGEFAGDAFFTLHLQCMLLKPKDPVGLPPENYLETKKIFDRYLSDRVQKDFIGEEALIRIELDNGQRLEKKHFFRFHDFEIQLLEDVWFQVPLTSRIRRIMVSQYSGYYNLHIARITARTRPVRHLETGLPAWGITGEMVHGRIYASHPVSVVVSGGREPVRLSLVPGWNPLYLICGEPAVKPEFTISDGRECCRAEMEAVYALSPETPEVMVGCDFTTVPHDDNGDMDQLLEYISRTRLGNTVVFRNFRPYPSAPDVDDRLLKRWGEYCAAHRIFVQSVNCHASGALAAAAGKYMHNGGWHEFAGTVYAGEPDPENPAADMKDACHRFIDYVRRDVEGHKQSSFRYGYGDAGGGARYLFQAGLEYIRAETMVPHTQQLCSLVRPASRIYGQGDWGVHIAVQHSVQPYIPEWHFGQYFLSLYMAWAMGAANLYEEDSLFITFKEEQQSWDDQLPKVKRQMTRDFYRFAATHPRRGELQINIASLEGRYEAPFNGFICGSEQDPSYSVWGGHGGTGKEWGHLQPEKKHHLLDVLMPGASVHPLRQQEDKRRFYFSGTPYGDFDQLPVEAPAEILAGYKLLLNLGWHTANEDDQQKIAAYVAGGGVYFAGITEYSCHTGREFLLDMADLKLYRSGEWADFAGIRVKGRGERFSGSYDGIAGDGSLSRTYSFHPGEDGECFLADIELCGAEVVVCDKVTKKPLIVRHRYGRGMVYTLCAWAYPGHDALAELMAVWLRHLCDQFKGDISVRDESREVFWNVRNADNCRILTMLNTDWTSRGNVKAVTVDAPGLSFGVDSREGMVKIIWFTGDKAIETDGDVHLEIAADGGITAHGAQDCCLYIHEKSGRRILPLHFTGSTVQKLCC
ncbi:MAG: hypothetical protein J6S43_05925 [Lentisphaeria bacterium]|nr:hypothetical protein [Lentisphaeria bacterium]